MSIIFDNTKLTNIEFRNTENFPHYAINDDKGKEIKIEYFPILDEAYVHSDFEIHLFENNYLKNEDDVFQINLLDNNKRIGWIFPINNLEGKEHSFYENIHLNKYKFVAYRLIIESLINSTDSSTNQEIKYNVTSDKIKLTDLLGDDLLILILCKNNLPDDFNIFQILPNLAQYGYYLNNNIKNLYDFPTSIRLQNRGKTNINVKCTHISKQDIFTKELLTNHLKTHTHPLIRLYLLYQIVEGLITKNFDVEFNKLLTDYGKNKIDKNSFIEKINEQKKERKNIISIFNKIKDSSNISAFNDFNSEIIAFFTNNNIPQENEVGSNIYNLRNFAVHNYRNINIADINLFEKITERFEILVLLLIQEYK